MEKDRFFCADGKHAVITVVNEGNGSPLTHARVVCPQCPWRKDSPIGAFPADAYKHSAYTAYDQAMSTFACHMSKTTENPAVCAGFLLRNADNNLGIRLAILHGRYDPHAVRKTVPLYKDYRAMAIANGVAKNDPAIAACRANNESWKPKHRSGLPNAFTGEDAARSRRDEAERTETRTGAAEIGLSRPDQGGQADA